MFTLYYAQGACSLAVHVMLRETATPFSLKRVSLQATPRDAELMAVNPRGQVPVLVDSAGTVMREGAAILLHLCETHASPLMPRSGAARAEALEWLAFCNATLHPAYATVFFLLRQPEATTAVKQAAVARVQKLWDEVEQHLASRDYLCGNQCMAADILLTVIANWGQAFEPALHHGPRTKALLSRVIARPAFQAALAEEEVSYKAAA